MIYIIRKWLYTVFILLITACNVVFLRKPEVVDFSKSSADSDQVQNQWLAGESLKRGNLPSEQIGVNPLISEITGRHAF
jgi:hypothetical protein